MTTPRVVNPAAVQTLHVGDIVFTGKLSQGITSLAIKLGQRLRHGFKSPYVIWSHCAIVVDAEKGLVCEAVSSGVKINAIADRFPDGDFAVLSVGERLHPHDRGQIMDFLGAVLESKAKYGFWTFAGLALYCLTGSKLCIQKAGTSICSGLVCDAYTRAGVIWERPPYAMTPADIAKHYDFHYSDSEDIGVVKR